MILGKIFGKITTTSFKFIVEKESKKFEYVQVLHKVYDYVLCQIVEIERTDKDIAECIIIGYKDEKGRIKPIRIPFDQNSEVLKAEDDFIKSVIKLEDSEKGAFLGKLEGKNIDVKIDLRKLLTKHVAILAKSGAGKSYCVGVLIEEIIDKKVPILIIDPHGEYGSLKNPNNEDKDALSKYNLKPKKFNKIFEYGDSKINPELRPLRLNNNLTPTEITHLLPGKLSGTQMGLLYSALKHIDNVNFTNVLLELDKEENNSKWTIINNLEHLNNMEIFSESFIPYNEFIQPGRCSIINLKGVSPDIQEIIVYKLMKDLFEMRKKNKIPPFFTVIEEAHNYCPERSFGQKRSSQILRTVASEGRKFGLGLCVVSQRPARVDKSVLSQCTTQIILKVTNPNDLKAIVNSVEGITSETEDEIKNLSIGTALVTGVVDMPLFVNVRTRMTEHGGHATDILQQAEETDFFEEVQEFEETDLLPIIKPKITAKDIKLMSEKPIKEIHETLVPGYLFLCKDKTHEYNLLVESVNGKIITNVDEYESKSLPNLDILTPKEIKVLHTAFMLKSFSKEDLIKKGLPLDIDVELKSLESKKYIIKGEKYQVSDNFILSHLSKHACYNKIDFLKINYDLKLDPKQDIDKIKENISKFTTIKDQRECFVLKHEIIYENGN
ncbi:ATP-binding protein [archaeon]|jgi:uncharacterized protein|nr:ATP-binding protein [archaeon]MBT4022257.1 ATP-binding protein [archaeon]MBT4272921.1 ATP-binding protein [archaeon]MBT4460664.1 ATP-binding protein [archaeon]MBT4857952.1 ATP-binding protein [archaeon]